ncbi:aldo/keto reductase [Mesobaculum littorinae]|uniref:Aldo/keto reductase n=1 Tax=Mesobaculum littorinae TaxID=2486419 RepID=A0A438AFU7_9RHOB|nr:aldo/keto reductase [Mesobaculum littorinae]RVV97576.1 aldo/keto reductase [Mesobaculum littorinae]
MKRTTLGTSGIEVSEFCLGTMTWGRQNTEAEGHAQIDQALDAGVDFLDTAEMYPTNPVLAETIGGTEEIIGSWLARTGRRGDVVLATKMLAEGSMVRDGRGADPQSMRAALEGSLRRLGTDYVDLYQIHWPDRGSYHFRQIWEYDPTGQDRAAVRQNMADVAGTLSELRDEGKIRAYGPSNETAWGTARWNDALAAAGAPAIATIQNEYNLLCRLFDGDLAETCHHEQVTLLAFSPLAAGLLTGKYQDGAVPEGSRMALTPNLGGRVSERVWGAVAAYHALAREYDTDPVQMALAWTRSRPVPTIPILGATTPDQLSRALGAAELVLSDELLEGIDAVHKAWPMPY